MSIEDELRRSDYELNEADRLLQKADALLRRHGVEPQDMDEDDLPLVTEIVPIERSIETLQWSAAPFAPEPDTDFLELGATALFAPQLEPAPAATPSPLTTPDPVALAEQLIDIDTAVSREVESWMSKELPQILQRELDQLNDRVRAQVMGQLRATLLPKLSEEIARRLTQDSPLKPPGA